MLKIFNSRFFPFIIFFVLSFAPLFWYSFNTSGMYIGAGDFISPINITNIIVDRMIIYSAQLYGGIDYSFITAHLFPFFFYYLILSVVGITPLFTTLLFISSILFVSGVSMYYFLDYVIKTKFSFTTSYRVVWLIFGAILYELSPFLLWLIHPGHLLLLISYALFPLILLYYDKLLNSVGKRLYNILFLSVIFLFSASSFANIGILYTILLILFVYTTIVYLVEKVSFRKAIGSYVQIVFVSVISNLWWLLPYLSSINATVSLNLSSATGITDGLSDATRMASIVNIFLGKPEVYPYISPMFYSYLESGMLLLFLILVILFVYALSRVNKHKYILVLVGMVVLGIYVSKGVQPPLSGLFSLFYDYFPGFKVFRRPVSKFYWEFLFFYFSIISVSLFILENRIRSHINIFRGVMVLFIIFSSILLFISFVRTPAYKDFSIPKSYYQAGEYLTNENVSRVLLLPHIKGQHPSYGKFMNNFQGADFLAYIWDFSQIQPDLSDYSVELPYKNVTNDLYIRMMNQQSFCDNTKQLGISHIVVRHDLVNKLEKKDAINRVVTILERSGEISDKKVFIHEGKLSLSVYSLDSKCRDAVLSSYLSNGEKTNLDYQYVNDSAILVTIPSGKDVNEIHYLTNYSNIWKLYEIRDSESITIFDELKFLFQKPEYDNTHEMVNGFGNKWTIPMNPDKPKSYVIYYHSQIYFWVGSIVTILYFIIVGIFSFKLYKKHTNK